MSFVCNPQGLQRQSFGKNLASMLDSKGSVRGLEKCQQHLCHVAVSDWGLPCRVAEAAYTRILARDIEEAAGGKPVLVNAVCPGFCRTNLGLPSSSKGRPARPNAVTASDSVTHF
jgi:hypothetical protein